jgi:septal ring factor EnvC (AmiA/AmiB activator)
MQTGETASVQSPVPVAVGIPTPRTFDRRQRWFSRRRTWLIRIAVFAAFLAGIGFLIGNAVQADAQYGRAHTALRHSRQQKVNVLSELAAVRQNLRLVNGQVAQTNTALTNDTAQLREVETALANAQSNVSTQQSTISALHSCLGGVEQSLNALSVGDQNSADDALVAVSAACQSAVAADG